VRDVADLHIRAMAAPGAAGKRFIAVSDTPPMSYLELAGLLRERFGPLAAKAPTEEAPADELPRLVIHNDGPRTSSAGARARWRRRSWTRSRTLRERGELSAAG